VGNYLKRPTWQALAKLQSIPEEFTAKNAKLFGNGAASGNSGEPIRRLGNAVNVRLVTLLGELLKKELST
jgi:site-specific DNA-cytosine methylase